MLGTVQLPTNEGVGAVSAWAALVSVALVGTERKAVGDDLAASVAEALGAPLPAATAEAAVLSAAGVLATWRRAGLVAGHATDDPPPPAPPDDRPEPSATAVQLLELLLAGQVPVTGGTGPLVAEWLARAGATNRRVPARLLPQLLAVGTASPDPDLRAGVPAAGGPRLRWLAARNPAWAWAAGGGVEPGGAAAVDHEARWTTGAREERLALLAELRATDPDEARRLVALTWSGEDAKDRASILAALATGLGPADEPFLEAALDDRSKVVRPIAADLLARLPSSALAARMAERLRPLVDLGGRLRRKLEVAYPEEPDAAARRDGIVDAGAPPKLGPRAWHLAQVVAAAPLRTWEDDLGLAPETVAKLADAPELRLGLGTAARRQGDARWAAALLPHHPDPHLLGVLDPADLDRQVGDLLGRVEDKAVATVLGSIPAPWSAGTSTRVVDRLRTAKATPHLPLLAPILAARLDPAALPAVESWVQSLRSGADGAEDGTRRHARGIAHALSIRRTIAQELP